MKKEKEIPLKNYILLSIILIFTIVIVIYLFMWYSAYENNKLENQMLDECLMVINYNELENYIVENKDAIIYTSSLNNIESRTFENKFKNIIKKNNLDNTILYLDLTKDKSIIEEMKEKYNKDLTGDPSLLTFKNGELEKIYNIKENNYNIKKIEKYLEEEYVMNY